MVYREETYQADKTKWKIDCSNFVITSGLSNIFEEHGIDGQKFLHRHMCGDWGDLCEEDVEANNQSFEWKGRLMSVWTARKENHEEICKFWIITDSGWQVTTLLLPSEY